MVEAGIPSLRVLRNEGGSLRDVTEAAGQVLAPRLTIYPEYALQPDRWLDDALRFAVLDRSDAEGLARDTGNLPLYEMSKRIEEIMNEAVAAKGIFPNVDFYSATTYWSLGLDLDLFTPMFALSRMSGWTGHCIEYLKSNKLIRPGAAYVGPHEVPYVAMDDR